MLVACSATCLAVLLAILLARGSIFSDADRGCLVRRLDRICARARSEHGTSLPLISSSSSSFSRRSSSSWGEGVGYGPIGGGGPSTNTAAHLLKGNGGAWPHQRRGTAKDHAKDQGLILNV